VPSGRLSADRPAALHIGRKKIRCLVPARLADLAATTLQRVELIFSVLQVVISIVLIFLVLMHSGKDAGLSGAFGVGSGQGPLGGGSLVERNLNRWTIGFAIAFAINTILLLKKPFW
jgi:preprotein translocase subunit SecG